MYFNYRLQKHRCEILGFSTKNPRGVNTFKHKCTCTSYFDDVSGLVFVKMWKRRNTKRLKNTKFISLMIDIMIFKYRLFSSKEVVVDSLPLSSTNVRQISICKMACLKEAWKLLEKPHLAKLYVRKNPVGISMFCDLKLRKHQTQGYPLTSLLTESSVNVAFSANNSLLLLNHFRSCPICAEICTGEDFLSN